jgi:peptidoglycan/LPS O-acetylase OafA/YrhL
MRKSVHGGHEHGFNRRVNSRAVQLDGLRGLAMVAIAWDHWLPRGWFRIFPFEVFLFFFLVLTGYLITGSLLRERDRGESSDGPWKWQALKIYQLRRGLRILAPYYAALALAWIVRAPDVTGLSGIWYLLHLSNLHIAFLGHWPAGTSHFWSLAVQQQFYLLWPLVIWFLPRRLLVPSVLVFTLIGPVTRWFYPSFETWVSWPNLMTWTSFDYFGIGGLLALAVHHGMSLRSPGLRWLAGLSLVGYLLFFIGHDMGWPTFGVRSLQQTFLAIALCGLIAAAARGFPGRVGKILETPMLQRIGQVSYGIYLFHNLAPLVTGKLMWFLWNGHFETGFGALFRIAVFAAVTWTLALASWRWLEQPLQKFRSDLEKPRF